ncbi:hypothetical protein [Streptomyces sp. HUAS ZL42]|uniref:hypothetical protein n=1 Tax=Streptomyces sp. HUAS ZL42 TaxID=3231715 RepID=UPI00345ED376
MSRTAHHVPTRHRTHPAYWPLGTAGPCTGHVLTELRYAENDLTQAERDGRRPTPTLVVRSFAAYTYPRALNERLSSPYESTARAALRAFRTSARKHLRAARADTLLLAAEELDHPPTRHRHRDLWEA